MIGNSQYAHAQTLPQPAKDADAMGELLKKAAFEVVTVHRDLGVTAMRRAIREFVNLAPDADIAVLYYAGHGIEVGGSNYLIPVDATLASDRDVPDEAISFDRLVRELGESGGNSKRLRLMIVDACVENPFVRTMKITSPAGNAARLPTMAGDRGTQPRDGLLIAYAAKAGQTCDDHGDHSVFTSALLKNLTVPGLDIRLAFGRIRDDVMKATDGKQEPFVYGALSGDALPLVPGKTPADHEQSDYQRVQKIGTKKAWQVFLQIYPTGIYADLARQHIQGAKEWRFAAPDMPRECPDLYARLHGLLAAFQFVLCSERLCLRPNGHGVVPCGGRKAGGPLPRGPAN